MSTKPTPDDDLPTLPPPSAAEMLLTTSPEFKSDFPAPSLGPDDETITDIKTPANPQRKQGRLPTYPDYTGEVPAGAPKEIEQYFAVTEQTRQEVLKVLNRLERRLERKKVNLEIFQKEIRALVLRVGELERRQAEVEAKVQDFLQRQKS